MEEPQHLRLLLCFVVALQKEPSLCYHDLVSVVVSLTCYLLYRILALSAPAPVLPPLLCFPLRCHVRVLSLS